MKILHVVHGFLPEFRGGTELYVDRLCRAQRGLGHDTAVFCGSNIPAGEDSLEQDLVEGLPVYRVHRRAHFVEEWQKSLAPKVEDLFRGFLESDRPDVVHLHHWKRLSRRLVHTAREVGIPVVLTFHDLYATCPVDFRIRDGGVCKVLLLGTGCSRCAPAKEHQERFEVEEELGLFKSDLKREVEGAAVLLAPSGAQRRLVAELLEIPPESIEVVPHGRIVDPERFERRASAAFPAGPLRVGHWGALDEIKGTDLLLEALDRLPDLTRVELHFFGKPITDRFARRLDRERSARPVILHGPFRPEDLTTVPLDLAAFPSRCYESYSFVLDEAFALGVPVIVSDAGALPERLQGAGFIVPTGRADAIADVLLKILDDPSLLEEPRRRIPRELPAMCVHVETLVQAYGRAIEHRTAPWAEVSDRAALALRTAQHEERELSILELASRVGFLEKRGFSLEALAFEERQQAARLTQERDSLIRERDGLKEGAASSAAELEGWRRLARRWWMRPLLGLRRGLLKRLGRRSS